MISIVTKRNNINNINLYKSSLIEFSLFRSRINEEIKRYFFFYLFRSHLRDDYKLINYLILINVILKCFFILRFRYKITIIRDQSTFYSYL